MKQSNVRPPSIKMTWDSLIKLRSEHLWLQNCKDTFLLFSKFRKILENVSIFGMSIFGMPLYIEGLELCLKLSSDPFQVVKVFLTWPWPIPRSRLEFLQQRTQFVVPSYGFEYQSISDSPPPILLSNWRRPDRPYNLHPIHELSIAKNARFWPMSISHHCPCSKWKVFKLDRISIITPKRIFKRGWNSALNHDIGNAKRTIIEVLRFGKTCYTHSIF